MEGIGVVGCISYALMFLPLALSIGGEEDMKVFTEVRDHIQKHPTAVSLSDARREREITESSLNRYYTNFTRPLEHGLEFSTLLKS